MRFRLVALAIALALTAAAKSIPPGGLAGQLEAARRAVLALHDRAGAVALERELPSAWDDSRPGALVPRMDLGWLHAGLLRMRPGSLPSQAQALAARLAWLQAQYTAAATPPGPANRTRLTAILAGREFRDLGTQSALERLRAHILGALFEFLARFFRVAPVSRGLGEILLALLLLLAASTVVWLLLRALPPRPSRLHLPAMTPLAPGWRDWATRARRAMRQGHWQEAVHCAYAAGAGWLAAEGAWQSDPARTPRESVALLREAGPSFAPRLSAWQGLAGACELLCYGGGTAGESALAEAAIADLESLTASLTVKADRV